MKTCANRLVVQPGRGAGLIIVCGERIVEQWYEWVL